MKRNILFLLVAALPLVVRGQERIIFRVPDLPGYKTLLCDFHMHTVFSDGEVWPSVRVDEAWKDGLDAIAITDHLEYLPHNKDMVQDPNRAFEIAVSYARNRDVIVVPGTEITKGMPPGHFNAIFIKDAASISNPDYFLSIEEAAAQGAFIFWNHPGWTAQQPDTMKWWDEHSTLYEKGWMHGIEVANGSEFYPEAVDWALEKDLTILGNSDVHSPVSAGYFDIDQHRTCTFVFVAERSPGGIREALFNGRTAAFQNKNVVGRSDILKSLLVSSLRVRKASPGKSNPVLVNPTSLQFDILLKDKIYRDWELIIDLKPGHEVQLHIPTDVDPKNIRVEIENFITGSGENLEVSLSEFTIVDQ